MTFRPYSKEQSLKGTSKKIRYRCSDGTMVTQDTIDRKRREVYRTMMERSRCSAYPWEMANDHDHTISQARCKKLGKTELIWDTNNIELTCREAHKEWESYRSGIFETHDNIIRRMLYVKKHDPENFEKRYQCLSNYRIMKELK